MAHPDWTLQALHLACAMARNTGVDVTLMRMIPVQHYGWLGTEMGNQIPTAQDFRLLNEYEKTAETYGVELTVVPMQYVSLKEAIVQAAHHLEAKAVFATLPQSSVAYWRKFQMWDLQRQLGARQFPLYSLEPHYSAEGRVASVAIPAPK
jgi:hypothetical protein